MAFSPGGKPHMRLPGSCGLVPADFSLTRHLSFMLITPTTNLSPEHSKQLLFSLLIVWVKCTHSVSEDCVNYDGLPSAYS